MGRAVQTPRREPDLSYDELRILREMIAERQYDQARSRFLTSTWKRGRAVVVAVVGLAVLGLQVAAVYISYLVLLASKGRP